MLVSELVDENLTASPLATGIRVQFQRLDGLCKTEIGPAMTTDHPLWCEPTLIDTKYLVSLCIVVLAVRIEIPRQPSQGRCACEASSQALLDSVVP